MGFGHQALQSHPSRPLGSPSCLSKHQITARLQLGKVSLIVKTLENLQLTRGSGTQFMGAAVHTKHYNYRSLLTGIDIVVVQDFDIHLSGNNF